MLKQTLITMTLLACVLAFAAPVEAACEPGLGDPCAGTYTDEARELVEEARHQAAECLDRLDC